MTQKRFFSTALLSARASTGVLVLRVVFGLAFVLHGSSKAPRPTTWATRLVPGLPGWLQVLVVVAEAGGGLLLLLGALNAIAALLISLDMVGAFLTTTLPHGGTTFVDDRAGAVSYEKDAVYLAVAVGLLLVGPGRYSFDALFSRSRKPRE